MGKIIIYTSIVIFAFASFGIAETIDPALVKNLEVEGGTALFATVQKVMKDGKETDVVVFNNEGVNFCPVCLDKIFASYGLSIDPAIVKSKNFPSSFAIAGKKIEEGKEVEVVNFSKTSVIYSPDLIHEILTAYGLQLTPDAVKNLPTGYATVVEKEDVKTIVFKKNGGGYSPLAINQILEAYHK